MKLNIYAVSVAIWTFLVVISGAWETSVRSAPGPPDTSIASIHFGLGIAAGVVVIGLAIALMVAGFRALGIIALACVAGEILCAVTSAAVSHAVLAQVLFAVAVLAAVCSSGEWRRGPEIVLDRAFPALRSLANVTAVSVFAQVVLGAAFRHRAMGLTWHIVGAMVVALAILFLGMCVMQQFPKHPALRPYAIALLTIALVQVLLGIAAITTEMMAADNTVPSSLMVSTAAHVVGGALTLAATLVLTVQIRRNVQKAAEESEEESAASA